MEDLLPADLIADPYTRQVVSAIVLLIGLAVLWFIWKFFYTVFKHVLVGLFMLVLGSGAYWYFRSSDPPRAPEVGKHAYRVTSKRYLGKVAGVINDQSKGIIFNVRAPGGQIESYPKGTIILKDEMIDEPTPTPFPTGTPSQLVKPGRSGGGKKGAN